MCPIFPVGLLAWIYDKLNDWSDGYPCTDGEILTWINLYLFSRAGPTASSRIYYEDIHDMKNSIVKINQWLPDVKLGVVYFPKEVLNTPKLWPNMMGPVVFKRSMNEGVTLPCGNNRRH